MSQGEPAPAVAALDRGSRPPPGPSAGCPGSCRAADNSHTAASQEQGGGLLPQNREGPDGVQGAGQTGLAVSRLGLGLAALGRPGYINLGHAADLRGDYDVGSMEARAHA